MKITCKICNQIWEDVNIFFDTMFPALESDTNLCPDCLTKQNNEYEAKHGNPIPQEDDLFPT